MPRGPTTAGDCPGGLPQSHGWPDSETRNQGGDAPRDPKAGLGLQHSLLSVSTPSPAPVPWVSGEKHSMDLQPHSASPASVTPDCWPKTQRSGRPQTAWVESSTPLPRSWSLCPVQAAPSSRLEDKHSSCPLKSSSEDHNRTGLPCCQIPSPWSVTRAPLGTPSVDSRADALGPHTVQCCRQGRVRA